MDAALPSEKFIPDCTASHPIFKTWIPIVAYFHPGFFLPEMTKTERRQQTRSLYEPRFEPGTFQMRRIVKHTSRETEQRQQTEMKKRRPKAERYEGQKGTFRQRRHRWVSLWMLMYLLWLLLYSATNRKCASCNHYPSISEWAKYRTGQDLRNICARSSTSVTNSVTSMFTASITSNDTQRLAMTGHGGSSWWAGQAAR